MFNTFIEKLFEKKMSIKRIEKHIKTLPNIQDTTSYKLTPNKVSICTVQRKVQYLKTIEAYIDMLFGFVEQGVNQKSQLIIFPEYNFFDLFGLIPGFGCINHYLKNNKTNVSIENKNLSALASIFKSMAAPIQKSVETIFSSLAKKSGMYIYTGSFLLLQEGELKNIGFLYGPDGTFIGKQEKIHLTDFEEQLGVKRGNHLKVFHLPIGRIALPICMDGSFFETFYRARELEVDLVILPIANMEEYNQWRAMRGIWSRVQESYVYGAKASLNGWIGGIHFTGKAGIFAPLGLTVNRDGVLSMASHFEGDQLVTATINYENLKRERREAQYFGDINPKFEKGYFHRTYYRGG